jgi:hypothetical protein
VVAPLTRRSLHYLRNRATRIGRGGA